MGAMENWGLVTYRTVAVLFEEGKSDAKYKNRIAYVVAHGKHFEYPLLFIPVPNLPSRTCASVVWKSCYNGLVERAVVKRGICNLGGLVGRGPLPPR